MILPESISAIGTLGKPHGIKGEIVATLDYDIDVTALRCIILDIDGIYVPFFVSAVRPKSAESVLLTIDGITDESQAAALSGKTLFALNEELGEEDSDGGFYVEDLVGYTLYDTGDSRIGVIEDVEDSTANTLLMVRHDGEIVYVPVAEELITGWDSENRTLTMNLPEGLLDI